MFETGILQNQCLKLAIKKPIFLIKVKPMVMIQKNDILTSKTPKFLIIW